MATSTNLKSVVGGGRGGAHHTDRAEGTPAEVRHERKSPVRAIFRLRSKMTCVASDQTKTHLRLTCYSYCTK